MDLQLNNSKMENQGTVNISQDDGTSYLNSNRTTVDVFTGTAANAFRSKEEMMTACQKIYSPMLRCMKLFGLYFGDTSMAKLRDADSMQCSGMMSFSFLYCIVANTCLWFNAAMVLVSLCMGGSSDPVNFFMLLSGLLWDLKTALNSVICFIVLPLTTSRKSRFEKFLRNLVESSIDLSKLKSLSMKVLIASGVAFILSSGSTIVTFLYIPWTFVANNKPWNNWHAFTPVSAVIISIFVAGAWLFPVAFICTTSSVLENLFDQFSKRVLSNCNDRHIWQLDLSTLKVEHRKLCDVVKLASDMLSPFFFVLIAAHVPLTCFCFYVSINPPRELQGDWRQVSYIVGTIFWLMLSSVTVAVIMVFGSRVNGKVSELLKAMYLNS